MAGKAAPVPIGPSSNWEITGPVIIIKVTLSMLARTYDRLEELTDTTFCSDVDFYGAVAEHLRCPEAENPISARPKGHSQSKPPMLKRYPGVNNTNRAKKHPPGHGKHFRISL